MKCQILFSGKNRNHIVKLSSENALRVIKVRNDALFFCVCMLRFYGPVNPLGSCRARQFT